MKDGQIIQNGHVEEILSDIKGKIFECLVDNRTAQILSEKYSVVNIREQGDATMLRVIANSAPYEGAVAVEGNLDDLYMYHFGEGVVAHE